MARTSGRIRFFDSVCLIAPQLYPRGFENVKEKVFAGRFQPVGGAWVEHDGNMPSSESIIRQNLLGQRYFQSRFRVVTFLIPNSALCRFPGGGPSTNRLPFRLEGVYDVILETIKRAEDDIDLPKKKKRIGSIVILRLYEAYGGHTTARLRIANLLEDIRRRQRTR